MLRRIFMFIMLSLGMQWSSSSTYADCADCAARAAQFWAAVQKDVTSASPALADYLARHELSHGRANGQNYYLTPDCGARPSQLEEVLDIAKSLHVRMTVFLMGNMIDRFPEYSSALLKRLVAEGHELGLHSYSHRSFVNMEREEMYDEVVRNWALIDWALGYHYPIRFIRNPYGARNADVMRTLGEFGLQHVFWDIDTLGWRDYATPQIVHDQVLKKIKPGAMIVFHCSSESDRVGLPMFVNALRAQGYEPQLLSAGHPPLTEAELRGYPKAPSPTPPPEPPPPTPTPPPVRDATPTQPTLPGLLQALRFLE
jgi:peptidoglycan/xylan/chitin deacetylase (PgdA/CDA1 family)